MVTYTCERGTCRCKHKLQVQAQRPQPSAARAAFLNHWGSDTQVKQLYLPSTEAVTGWRSSQDMESTPPEQNEVNNEGHGRSGTVIFRHGEQVHLAHHFSGHPHVLQEFQFQFCGLVQRLPMSKHPGRH